LGLPSRDLILIYHGGRVLLGLYSGACLAPDFFTARATGFLRANPTCLTSGAGTNHRPIVPLTSTETDPAGFWLKCPLAYRKNVAARFKGPRAEAYWESWHDEYERYAEWRRESVGIAPEPSTRALLLLSCLTLILAGHRRRPSKSFPPDHRG
jgi:hypothetical protein